MGQETRYVKYEQGAELNINDLFSIVQGGDGLVAARHLCKQGFITTQDRIMAHSSMISNVWVSTHNISSKSESAIIIDFAPH